MPTKFKPLHILFFLVACKGFEPHVCNLKGLLSYRRINSPTSARRTRHFSGVGWTLTNNLSYERINIMLSTPFILQRYDVFFKPPNLFLTFFLFFPGFVFIQRYKNMRFITTLLFIYSNYPVSNWY